MAIPKTWTATDIELGKLTVNCIDDVLYLYRRYQFVDNNNTTLPIEAGRIILETPLADIPTDILDALQTINQWTKQKALEQEGMA